MKDLLAFSFFCARGATLSRCGLLTTDSGGMQQLTFASRSLLTPTAVSDALLELVESLDPRRRSRIVSIPVLVEDGRVVTAKLLLHAGSELVSVPAGAVSAAGFRSEVVADAVRAIRSRIGNQALAVEYPVLEDEPPVFVYEESYV